MTDPLIDRLVGDLQPRRPLADRKLWLFGTACLVMIAVIILGIFGLRQDYVLAIRDGAMLWKPGIFLMAWIGSIFIITDLSRPVDRIKKEHSIPFIAAGGLAIWALSSQSSRFSWSNIQHELSDSTAIFCLSIITIGGGLAMALIWKYWISKTASRHPALLGAMSGLSAGCLAAAAYALHCDKDLILFVFTYYTPPLLVLSALGGILGQRNLRW